MNIWFLISYSASFLMTMLALGCLRHGGQDKAFKYLALCLISLAGLAAAPFYNAQISQLELQLLQVILYSLANLLPMVAALFLFLLFEEKDISNRYFWGFTVLAIFLDSYDYWLSRSANWPNEQLLIGIFEYFPQFIKIAYLCLGIYGLLRSWKSDLVHGRYLFRYVILMMLGLVGAEMLLIENLIGIRFQLPYDPSNFHSLWQFILAVWVFVNLFIPRSINWIPLSLPAGKTKSELPVKQDWIDWSFKVEELNKLLDEREIFRDDSLSLAGIAQELAIPEYRARQLINGELNYKNFNVFLNDYRIKAAIKDLQEPTKKHLPILTIAMDTGYSSLAPFNKAFKQRMGMTPSEFRRRK